MIGFDTCAIIDLIKNNEKIKEIVESTNHPFATSALVFSELIRTSPILTKKGEEEYNVYESFCSNTTELPFTQACAKKALFIHAQLKKQGKEIPKEDCLIAASYLAHGVTLLLTQNVKHFENIPGLTVLSY